MGLISIIKDTYYNYKLNNADSACDAKDFFKAEKVYLEILDKHPNAAEHLAKMYFDVAKFCKNEEKLMYLSKMKSLIANLSFGKDKVSIYLMQLVSYIEDIAEQFFNAKEYTKALKYLKSIEFNKIGDSFFAKKNRLYELYVNLNAVEFEPYYDQSLSLIDTCCKSDSDEIIEEAIIGTTKRLYEIKKLDRAYCISNCLAKKENKIAIEKCIEIAYQIYITEHFSGKKVIDEDFLLSYIKKNNSSNYLDGLEKFVPFSIKYRNEYIKVAIEMIASETDVNNAFIIFKQVWEISSDVSLIQYFAHKTSPISFFVFEYFIQNIYYLNSDVNVQYTLLKELYTFDDYKYVFYILEKFQKAGIDVRSEYIRKVKSIINSFDEDEQLIILNRTLNLFYDDSWAIDCKMAIGEKCQARKDFSKAFNIYSELVGLHVNAQPQIAQLYYEQSLEENDFYKKRELVKNAFALQESYKSIFNDKLISNLSSIVNNLIHDCFANNNPDEAFFTVEIFKFFISSCFNNYLYELKLYHDKDYVLGQLEKFKKNGIDIILHYKDVIEHIYESKEYSNQYKLDVLSKALDLFSDEYFYHKFISKGIEIVCLESDENKAIANFANVWNTCPDKKLLDVFVNQNYRYFKQVIDYLINKTSISKWDKNLIAHLCDNIFSFDDFRYSLSIFDCLTKKKISIQKPYIATVLKVLPLLGIDDRVQLINESLLKFNDKHLIDEKFAVANIFVSKKDFENAKRILEELIGLHVSAESKLASLYYEKAKKAKDIIERESFIISGLSFYLKHSSVFDYDEYLSVFKKLLKTYDSLIDKYYSLNDYENAFRLCLELKKYDSTWYDKFIELKLLFISNCKVVDDKINKLYETFHTLEKEGIDLINITSENIYRIWKELSESLLQQVVSLSYVNRINVLNDFISYLISHCEENIANDISKQVKAELISTHKKQGRILESETKLSEAIDIYNLLQNIADDKTISWCKIRSTICQIKQGQEILESEVRNILSFIGFVKEKNDLSYRYAISLILRNNIKEALDFIKEFIPNEKELVNVCNNLLVREAEQILNDLNKKINKLKLRETTLAEAMQIRAELDVYDNKISPYLHGVHDKIEKLRTSLQSYILLKCYEEEEFDRALKLLKESGKNWYDDDIYFRNVAIACLGIVESGKINKTNYKIVISYWLTAVYSDKLFVSSLGYTSWDNSYIFTLSDSLGGCKEDSFDFLPDNVTFDDPIEGSVISIAEVQQNLLNRFELALNDKDDIFIKFYEEQKNAMDSLVALNMDEPCIIVAPYLANNTRKCFNEIKSTLDYEYDNYGGENILKVGVLYNISTGIYQHYKDALNNMEKCISAVRSMSITQVKTIFINSIIETIKEFDDLYSSFSTEIQNILLKVIKDGVSYKSILKIFSVICKVVNDNTLSYVFGNYINQNIISKLNEKSLDLGLGLQDLVSAYSVAKSCIQLKDNIGRVLEALVGRYVTEEKLSDLEIIKSVLKSTGTEFEVNLVNILTEEIILMAVVSGHIAAIEALTTIPAKSVMLRNKLTNLKTEIKELSLNFKLSQIVDKVNKKGMSLSSALQEVYCLYEINHSNSRVCDNLCTLVSMCIQEYIIPDKVGKTTVMTIFNKLKFNKSATYRNSAKLLKKERQNILNQLPSEARILLTGGTSLNSSLNAEGIKLKNALQLYLDLA